MVTSESALKINKSGLVDAVTCSVTTAGVLIEFGVSLNADEVPPPPQATSIKFAMSGATIISFGQKEMSCGIVCGRVRLEKRWIGIHPRTGWLVH